MLGMDLLIH